MTTPWFSDARFGLFIHFGLYSMLGRGEWVLNTDHLPIAEYKALADRFDPVHFDADRLIGKAKQWGMKYAVLTTKHHDGFCLYDSQLSEFTAPKTNCGRDLVAEFVEACRRHGLKVGLYHTLNDWTASPNAVDALERPDECYQPFIEFVHGQIREIMTRYGKIDIMWYDGWWPFTGRMWQGKKLNDMVRTLQPGILVNNRTGVPGDFGTPEGHITAADGMWEACMTLNDHWGYHAGDDNWKDPKEVCSMLQKVAQGSGNLLLNVGPAGDGSIPQPTVEILDRVGRWLEVNGQAIYGSERFGFHPQKPHEDDRGDWNTHGGYSAVGNNLYLHVTSWPGSVLRIVGLKAKVQEVRCLACNRTFEFQQNETALKVTGLPETADVSMPMVLRFRCDSAPSIYRTGGYRVPNAAHPRYDPETSDIAY